MQDAPYACPFITGLRDAACVHLLLCVGLQKSHSTAMQLTTSRLNGREVPAAPQAPTVIIQRIYVGAPGTQPASPQAQAVRLRFPSVPELHGSNSAGRYTVLGHTCSMHLL